MADDIYQGMFIPKGSIVVPNVRCGRFYDTYIHQLTHSSRSMTLDEKIYTKPHDFWPQRYLPKPSGNEEPYPGSMFGFGRR